MVEYTEQAVLVDELRACAEGDCERCPKGNHQNDLDCMNTLYIQAADMIEALFKRSENCEALEKENAELEDEVLRLRKELEELK